MQVDVIIPCYNQGRFLADAIDSVLGQSYPHVRAIVVDDGSTDDTQAVAARYGERVVTLSKANAGLAAARNTGLLEADGEFIVCLDSDDMLDREMVAHAMEAARVHPDIDLFHGSIRHVDLDGRVLAEYAAEPLGEDPFHTLLIANDFACHCLMIRRCAFANAGLFDVTLKSNEDWDMWLRMAAAGSRFLAVPEAIALYRRYSGSMSRSHERMWRTGTAVLRRNAAAHLGCTQCETVLRQGIRHYRGECFKLLKQEMASLRDGAGPWAGVAYAAHATARDPALARHWLGGLAALAGVRR